MDQAAAESVTAIIFYSALGIAALITSIVIAFRYVKNCSSPICSCTQDTTLSSSQNGSTNSLTNGIMHAMPNIIKTVTTSDSTGQTIAGVVGDIAEAMSEYDKPSKSMVDNHAEPGQSSSNAITRWVNCKSDVGCEYGYGWTYKDNYRLCLSQSNHRNQKRA